MPGTFGSMCGRYVTVSSPALLAERFHVTEIRPEDFEPSYNVAPRADVPVVSYLSGGVDSSVVVAMASKVRGSPIPCFTIRIKGGVRALSRFLSWEFRDGRSVVLRPE